MALKMHKALSIDNAYPIGRKWVNTMHVIKKSMTNTLLSRIKKQTMQYQYTIANRYWGNQLRLHKDD